MLTVPSTGADIEPAVFADPLYVAVQLDGPTANFDVVNTATPPTRDFAPSDVDPFRNTTLPVGTGAPGSTAATVAVNVTSSPATLNGAPTFSTVVDDAGLTVADTGADVDASTVVEPL